MCIIHQTCSYSVLFHTYLAGGGYCNSESVISNIRDFFYIAFSVGVSLKLQGVTIPNNSLVDFDDILYRANREPLLEDPSNANATLHDEALLCVTDLVDCCDSPHAVHGDWYYPNGSRVLFDGFPQNLAFRRNRGPNEITNGRKFNGSVRLWRRFSPRERGHFRCELPSAADPSVNQTLYANICEFIARLVYVCTFNNYTSSHCLSFPYAVSFGYHHDIDKVTISPSTGSSTAGRTDYSLTCSSTLFDPVTLPANVPSPNFQWSFNGSASLPSGVTAMATVISSSNSTSKTYTSILLFSPLSQSYTGMYTCQLGAGRLVNNVMIAVNGKF